MGRSDPVRPAQRRGDGNRAGSPAVSSSGSRGDGAPKCGVHSPRGCAADCARDVGPSPGKSRTRTIARRGETRRVRRGGRGRRECNCLRRALPAGVDSVQRAPDDLLAPLGCDPALNPAIDEGERFQTLSWAFGGAAVALIAVGAAMVALGGPHEIRSQRAAQRTGDAWTLWATQAPFGSGGIAGVAARF